MATVLLADNQVMLRECMAHYLEGLPQISTVHQTSNDSSLLESIAELRPDIVILDLNIPKNSVLGTIESMHRSYPEMITIILSSFSNPAFAVNLFNSGVDGYLLKSSSLKELDNAIERTLSGRPVISTDLIEGLGDFLTHQKGKLYDLTSLSKREFQLIQLLAQGNRIKECAEQMHLSMSTVSTYRARIMKKLNLKSTTDIVRFAVECGITYMD